LRFKKFRKTWRKVFIYIFNFESLIKPY
jgi:hypothetical protein